MSLARLAAVLFLVLASAAAQAQPAPQPDLVARGEYLARAADCVACHTKKDGTPYAGGLGFKLPFGTLYAPNITPDKATGIGTWTDDEFVKAMQKGVGKGGKHLYPAFPYASYTLMPREDILAVKAYLFSLPPVHAETPADTLSFPFNQRWLMAFWNVLFNPDKRFEPDPKRPPEWNRGKYLVESLGHCGECHTPRNFLQARRPSKALSGAVTAGWRAYNITPDRETGIGAWSDQALASYLATGHAEGHSAAAGPMAEVVEYSLRYLTPEDIRAIVVYLKSAPAKRDSDMPAIAAKPPAVAAAAKGGVGMTGDNSLGAHVFAQACASCHRYDGTGAQTPYATLIGTRGVNDPEATNATQVVLHGASLDSPRGKVFMPGFGKAYSEAEIAAVVNYVTGRFGAAASTLTAEDVAKRRGGE